MPTPPPIPIPTPPPTPIWTRIRRARGRQRTRRRRGARGGVRGGVRGGGGARGGCGGVRARCRARHGCLTRENPADDSRRRSRPGSGFGFGFGLGDAPTHALRELEARMEANDRGAGGDAEEYDEFAAARIEREYLLDTSDDEDDPFATGEFGAGDAAPATDSMTTMATTSRTRPSRGFANARGRNARRISSRALARAKPSGTRASISFGDWRGSASRLARPDGCPCFRITNAGARRRESRRRARIPTGRRARARAWASRRAGEDPGESPVRAVRAGRRRRRGGRVEKTRRRRRRRRERRREGYLRPRGARAERERRSRRGRSRGESRVGADAGGFVRRVRARSSDDGCEGRGAGTPRLLRPCWRGCRGWIPGTIGWCARWRLWRDREGGGTKRGSMRGKGTRGRSVRNWRSANAARGGEYDE